jgi:hypothetical protein
MINGRSVIAAIVGALVVTVTGYADMVPASGVDIGCGGPVSVCGESVLLPASPSSLFSSPSIGDLKLWSVSFLPQAHAEAEQTVATLRPQTLTNGPNSLALCLSALMGLGLCSSLHWVKKLSFGFIPEWYHNGGPFQIGHSHAVTPISLRPMLSCCFVQPLCTADDPLPRYHAGTIESLLRKPRVKLNAVASRGPPVSS